MAKKAAKKSIDLIGYAKQILSFAVPLISENKDTIVKNINNIVNFKKIARKYMIISAFLFVALFFLLNGIVILLDSIFPGFMPGSIHIFIGFVLLLFVAFYSRQKI
jgi:predicted metal-dependent phosphoesterase TrpH